MKIRPAKAALRSLAAETRAAEIAETAMILPLLFMIVLAIFWMGQAFRIYGTITHAARQGARAAVTPVCATCASGNSAATNASNAVAAAMSAASLSTAQISKPATAPTLYTCGTPPAICGAVQACDGTVLNMCVQTNVQLSSCTQTSPGEATCGTSVSFVYQNSFHFTIPFTNLDLGNMSLPAQAQMRGENQ
ncbi:MAG TPA: TadE family protein [Candidatus Binatia bacterium]|nr:TadE family protein [Candidatus Binatia bacterium]